MLASAAPCDVAALVTTGDAHAVPGASAPVLVPFGGAEHEWAAAEVGAWIARSVDAPLRLLGTAGNPERGQRDASRLLATASLAIQRVSGVIAEPLIAGPGPEAVIAATKGTGLVIIDSPTVGERRPRPRPASGRAGGTHGRASRPRRHPARWPRPDRKHEPLHLVARNPELTIS